MELSNLRPAEGSKHSDNFRRGRGHGSGNGKTAGKGHKGQLASIFAFAVSLTAFTFTLSFLVSSPFPRILTPSPALEIARLSSKVSTVTSVPSSKHKKTVAAMGLTKMHKTVEMPDNAATRGMIQQVQHLVKVEEA